MKQTTERKGDSRSRRRTRRHRVLWSAAVETLEQRRMLAVTAVYTDATDTLTIAETGVSQGDSLLVGQSSGNVTVTNLGTAVVITDSLTGNPITLPAASVALMSVGTGGTKDTIDLSGVLRADFTALTGVTINGGTGGDTIVGSDARDEIDGFTGDDSINGGNRDDTILGGEDEDTIDGGDGDDSIEGGIDDDSIFGGASDDDDTIEGNDGNDVIDGGDGDDDLEGNDDADVIVGGLGNDNMNGGSGGDNLNGGAGEDVLNGASGDDILIGGDGGDRYVFRPAGAMNDTIGHDSVNEEEAHTGLDIVEFDEMPLGVTFSLSEPNFQTIGTFGSITLNNTYLEGIIATDGDYDDTLTGNGSANLIIGRGGDDAIYGLDQGDSLDGGAGGDVIEGGAGNDTITGGEDADNVKGQGDADVVSGGPGDDTTVSGGAGNDTVHGGGFILAQHAGALTGINGASGAVVGRLNNVLWIIDDSLNNNSLYASDPADGDLVAAFTLNGASAVNYEDIAYYKDGSTDYIYIADIGDNEDAGGRTGTVVIYRVAEPSPGSFPPVGGTGSLTVTQSVQLAYPGLSSPPDAETLIVDPLTGDLYIVTKKQPGQTHARLYYAPKPTSWTGGTITLQDKGPTAFLANTANDSPSGGDISSNGLEVLIKSDNTIYRYERTSSATSLVTLLTGAPQEVITFRDTDNRVGIAFTPNAQSFYTVSENDPDEDTGEEIDRWDRSSGADTLFGDTSGVPGDTGHDTLFGGLDGDSISGGPGNDAIHGGAGNDTMNGDADHDTYVFWGSSDLGSDSVNEAASAGIDWLDFLNFGQGATANISLASPTSQTVATGKLTLTLASGTSIENVQGSGFNDVLTGNTLDNCLFGNGGADLMYGDPGYYDTSNDTIFGGAGNDTVYGGRGQDDLYGDGDDDWLNGFDGDDTIQGGLGHDIAYGGYGHDSILGDSGDDRIYPGGLAEMPTGDGNDTMYGGSGNDKFTYVGTFQGADIIHESATPAESDTLNLEWFGTGVTFSLAVATAQNLGGGTLQIDANGVENIIGTAYVDSLTGDGRANRLEGKGGNDGFFGGNGNDTIFGGDGSDQLGGGTGNDSLYGQAGIDWIWGHDDDDFISGGLDRDYAYGGYGNDDVYGDEGDDWMRGGESWIAYGDGDDYMAGGDGADTLFGGDNNDTLNGDAGNDKLRGEDGDDLISGGLDHDTAYGGASSSDYGDTIHGDSGNDVLFGEAGKDFLFGDAGLDGLYAGPGDAGDYLDGGTDNDTLYSIDGVGDDTLYSASGIDTIYKDTGDQVWS